MIVLKKKMIGKLLLNQLKERYSQDILNENNDIIHINDIPFHKNLLLLSSKMMKNYFKYNPTIKKIDIEIPDIIINKCLLKEITESFRKILYLNDYKYLLFFKCGKDKYKEKIENILLLLLFIEYLMIDESIKNEILENIKNVLISNILIYMCKKGKQIKNCVVSRKVCFYDNSQGLESLICDSREFNFYDYFRKDVYNIINENLCKNIFSKEISSVLVEIFNFKYSILEGKFKKQDDKLIYNIDELENVNDVHNNYYRGFMYYCIMYKDYEKFNIDTKLKNHIISLFNYSHDKIDISDILYNNFVDESEIDVNYYGYTLVTSFKIIDDVVEYFIKEIL